MPKLHHTKTAYLGLGSNIGDPKSHILKAIDELRQFKNIKVKSISSIYQSKPVDGTNQKNYSNAVVCIQTQYSPIELLNACQAIEKLHERVHIYRWGPRTLDIDILCYEQLELKTPLLILPHPEIANRDFVLIPLLELNPRLSIPPLGLLAALPSPPKNILSDK